jgi:hypothetical protein
MALLTEELGRIGVEVVSLGAKVVVDDIQEHHEAFCMGGLHQIL